MPDSIPIPVCFDPEFGLDLGAVADHSGLSVEGVIGCFLAGEYIAAFLGFAPGFAYLDGVPEPLRVERLGSPRPRVAAGSVAIAGARAGVYPFATPGGWRILGRTPVAMFDAWREPPALVLAGDTVRFERIDRATFDAMERQHAAASLVRRPAHAAGEPAIRIVHPGVRSSIQDLGRPGYEAMGVPRGGAADGLSLRVANRLVGNADGDAAIECALGGLTLEFMEDCTIAVGGGDVAVVVTSEAGAMHELAMWRGVGIRAGERVRLGALRTGCRAYVSVAGGVDVPAVLGSRSTLASAGLGGLDGRELVAGDALCVGTPMGAPRQSQLPPGTLSSLRFAIHRRVLRLVVDDGVHATHPALGRAILASTFRVRPASDRVGVRLDPAGLLAGVGELINDRPSRAAGPGTVQVPSAAEVIVLLADAPPTGGYAAAGRVIGPDLCAVGQLRPGEVLRFEAVSEAEASALHEERSAWLERSVLGPR
jgi:biotin-dependent carboxylase-like uncharacterized protein